MRGDHRSAVPKRVAVDALDEDRVRQDVERDVRGKCAVGKSVLIPAEADDPRHADAAIAERRVLELLDALHAVARRRAAAQIDVVRREAERDEMRVRVGQRRNDGAAV